jgi:hypothetical protein
VAVCEEVGEGRVATVARARRQQNPSLGLIGSVTLRRVWGEAEVRASNIGSLFIDRVVLMNISI